MIERIPTGLEPLPEREVHFFAQMPGKTPDKTGVFDLCGVMGTVVFHDNATWQKELTTAELLTITAHNIGGSIIIKRNGKRSTEAQKHTNLYQSPEASYSILVLGVTPAELIAELCFFDPLENKIQC